MIEQSQAAGARVILAEMRIPPNYGATYAERFHAMYGELAAEYGATLLPFLLEEIALEPGMMMDDGIHPTVAAQPNGGFVVGWASNTSGSAGDGSGYGIFYQLFTNNPPTVTDVTAAEGVFIGGGNTFVLLRDLYEHGLIDPLRERIAAGMPYMGTSAGSTSASGSSPTILT